MGEMQKMMGKMMGGKGMPPGWGAHVKRGVRFSCFMKVPYLAARLIENVRPSLFKG